MRTKEFCILIFCSVLLFYCSSIRTVNGLYRSKYEYLKLNSDFSFSYEISYGYFLSRSSGNWTRPGEDKIVLESSFNPSKFPLDLSDLDDKELRVVADVSDDIDKGLFDYFSYRLVVNDTMYEMNFEDTVILKMNSTIKTFQLMIDFDNSKVPSLRKGISSEIIKFDSVLKDGILVKFDLNDEMLSYEYFATDTLMLSNSGFYWPNKGDRVFKKMKEFPN